MPTARRFPKSVIEAVQSGPSLGVRAGLAPHRFLRIWVVVVRSRVFIRSWNDKPKGWARAFLEDHRGVMAIGKREIDVRARRVRGEALMRAIEKAYAEKYHYAGARKWVVGFTTARRRATTTELFPR